MSLDTGEVDLVPSSPELVTQFDAVIEQRGVGMSIDTPAALIVQVDRTLLAEHLHQSAVERD